MEDHKIGSKIITILTKITLTIARIQTNFENIA